MNRELRYKSAAIIASLRIEQIKLGGLTLSESLGSIKSKRFSLSDNKLIKEDNKLLKLLEIAEMDSSNAIHNIKKTKEKK